jgi:hypothetical protein
VSWYITWTELGAPKAEGDVCVPGRSVVGIRQRPIEQARRWDGKVAFKLIPVGPDLSRQPQYRLGVAIPLGEIDGPRPTDSIAWQDLGAPRGLGTVLVYGLGHLEVTRPDFEVASQRKGQVISELVNVTGAAQPVACYRLGRVIGP